MIADRQVYLNLIDEVREAVRGTNATLSNSKELARALGTDPLKNTNLRIRGMYELKHPQLVFKEYIKRRDIPDNATKIYLIILKEDYENISNSPDLNPFYESGQLEVNQVLISDPNKPESNLDALLFEGWTL